MNHISYHISFLFRPKDQTQKYTALQMLVTLMYPILPMLLIYHRCARGGVRGKNPPIAETVDPPGKN